MYGLYPTIEMAGISHVFFLKVYTAKLNLSRLIAKLKSLRRALSSLMTEHVQRW